MSYDIVILGGGTGGYACAFRAAQLGMSVAIVEKDKVGGTCLHRGCIPTKAMLHSASVVDEVRRAGDFGVEVSEPHINWEKVGAFRDSTVAKLFSGLQGLISKRKIDVFSASGHLVAPDVVAAGGDELHAGRGVVLATGSAPRSIPGIEIDHETFISSDDALKLPMVPPSIAVIGGGAVGVEFASLYRSFGAQVTLLEALPRLIPAEDRDLGAHLQQRFAKRGITVAVGARVVSAAHTPDGAELSYESGGKIRTARVQTVLVAAGRGPVSEGLGYAQAAVALEKGFVVVDEYLRTGADRIWALGDLVTQPSSDLPFPHLQLAHVAFAEGIFVAEQVAGAPSAPVNYLAVGRAIYCHPEVASVGLTEQQATGRGADIEVKRFPFSGSGKAMILGDAQGFVKVIAERAGPVLGVHMIGPRVTELIAEAQLTVGWEALASEVAAVLHPHPTLSEGYGEAMLELAGKPLHGG